MVDAVLLLLFDVAGCGCLLLVLWVFDGCCCSGRCRWSLCVVGCLSVAAVCCRSSRAVVRRCVL